MTAARAVTAEELAALADAIRPGAARRDAERELPFEAVEAFRASGLGLVRVPVEHGGRGGTIRDFVEVILAVASADSNVAQALRPHFSFVERLLQPMPEAVRARWFEVLTAGELFGNGTTEIGTSSPVEFATRLRRDGGSFRLDGVKYYCTGTIFAERMTVLAVDDDDRVVSVVVPTGRGGVTVLDDFDAMGQRLTASGTTRFEGVVVHPDEILPPVPVERHDHAGTTRQLHLAAVSAGIARNVLTDTVFYVQNRARPAPHSIAATAAADPFVQETVGRISAHVFAAESAVRAAAEVLDEALRSGDAGASQEAAAVTATSQVVAGEAAMAAARLLYDTGGASAAARTFNHDRHWRNARTVASHNPLTYKAKVVGDRALNGTDVPANGYF